jgi:hypothetical protein
VVRPLRGVISAGWAAEGIAYRIHKKRVHFLMEGR